MQLLLLFSTTQKETHSSVPMHIAIIEQVVELVSPENVLFILFLQVS